MNIYIKGIKCDACPYTDNFGTWGETPEEILAMNDKYLNKACPDCGATLLTEADHQLVVELVVSLLPLVAVAEECLKKSEVSEDLLKPVSAKLVMDGSGKFTIEETPTL